MAALEPALVRVLETMRRVFDRPRNGLRTYDFDPDDRMFLRGSGSFKFTASEKDPRRGFVRIVGSPRRYRVEVLADFFQNPVKKSFSPRFLYMTRKMDRRHVRSPKVRKFATYALMRLKHHFLQLEVEKVHDL